jgi:hypothetical protein
MTSAQLKPTTPLLQGVSQYEVDFVIPRIGIDLPLGIDPFLLYKSRDPVLADQHDTLLRVFNYGIDSLRHEQVSDAQILFDFPEVAEIGLGYTRQSKKGSGIGNFLAQLIIETLLDSPLLLDRGVRHIEEMQLVSLGIGPDRVSDIAANLLKKYLIEYTQKQCLLWNIPLTVGVPIEHIFDPDKLTWYDGYFDLPVSSFDGTPILLVPRRVVRTLPWINYDDFFRMEFSTYLRAKRVRGRFLRSKGNVANLTKLRKKEVISITRNEIERIDHYVSQKEENAVKAQPSISYLDDKDRCVEVEALKNRLRAISIGAKDATAYHRVILEILNFLFNPELINGELEVRTVDGTERRDIIFTNDSDKSFWSYLRTEHSAVFLMFEVKNTNITAQC